ncbi:hypothetical protein [Candidatus Paracaedibacter symbiosus]|uniref:hypothetical protein n=1 Tax=Candidatus Paracaedibacter symbiosus TaxID=244582 RepID=UPI0005098C39|nr:hypothetical protein [Candidatus Paracaedibacter symbiosus]
MDIKNKIFLLGSAFTLFSHTVCSANDDHHVFDRHSVPVAASQYVEKYDFSKLVPFDFNEQMEFAKTVRVTSLPALATFHGNGRELRYLAVQHAIGASSPTFQSIRQTIEDFQPSCLILEGFENCDETIQWISEQYKKEPEYCGEPLYAAYLAKEKGVLFMSGEPTDQEIIRHCINKNYTKNDVAYFYFTRLIPQHYRQQKLSFESDLPRFFEDLSQMWMGIFNEKYTHEGYQSWCNEAYNKPLTFQQVIDTTQTSPILTGHKLQKIGYEVGLVRDKEILTRIFDSMQKYDKVLVIYGASHYFTQRKVLQH